MLKALALLACCAVLQACTEDPEGDGSSSNGSQGSDPAEPAAAIPPGPVACTAPPSHLQVRFLERINDARSVERQCGDEVFPAVGPLSWDDRLEAAARAHSLDMSGNNFFSHTGSDGGRVGTRVTAAGFEWRTVGENIARGQRSVADAVTGWLESPGHCRNIMLARYEQMAVACVDDSNSDLQRYWTQVLARPR